MYNTYIIRVTIIRVTITRTIRDIIIMTQITLTTGLRRFIRMQFNGVMLLILSVYMYRYVMYLLRLINYLTLFLQRRYISVLAYTKNITRTMFDLTSP